MRRNFVFPIRALGMLAASSPVLPDTLQFDAQSAATKWDEAFNSGDMGALGKLYTTDAIVLTKVMPQSGEGIQGFSRE